MSAGIEPGAAVSRPGLRASPGRAPACGARTRAGGSCLGLAMASGRCRIHGGASTGPRTAVGLARMVAAKTTHGRFAVSGAPKRLDWRFARTVVARIRLTAEATMLQAYLPAGMAARLDSVPEELLAPKHPSQVAFEAWQAAAGRSSAPARLGLGRRARAARARLGAGGGVVDGAAAALHGRAAERLATRAETASQAPWRAAIAAARALRQAMDAARGQVRGASNDPMGGMAGCPAPDGRNDPIGGIRRQTRPASNDPMCGMAGYRAPDVRNDPMRGTGRQTRAASNDPMGGTAGDRTPDVRNDPMGGTGRQTRAASNDPMGGMAGYRTPDGRNDPMRGTAVRTPAAGAPSDTRVCAPAERRAGEMIEWAPGSRGLWEALTREVEKRRLRAAAGLHGNDPIGGTAPAVGGAADGARIAPAMTGLVSMRGLAADTTTLARTWEPGVAEVLAARFGPPAQDGWPGVPVAPPGIAAMPRGGCAQRPYTRTGGLAAGGGWEPVRPVAGR